MLHAIVKIGLIANRRNEDSGILEYFASFGRMGVNERPANRLTNKPQFKILRQGFRCAESL